MSNLTIAGDLRVVAAELRLTPRNARELLELAGRLEVMAARLEAERKPARVPRTASSFRTRTTALPVELRHAAPTRRERPTTPAPTGRGR